jgi:hypothetical protein
MGFFQELNLQAREHKLDFLVIGGLAVIFHGYSRDTADLDLLVRRDNRTPWLELFARMSYTIYEERKAFVQLSPPKAGAWPVDLMFVADATFDPILVSAIPVEMFGAAVKIPILEHLIALKLHALKHGHIRRYLKDWLDVENLVRIHSLDLKTEEWRQIFLKYGTMEIYEKISRLAAD